MPKINQISLSNELVLGFYLFIHLFGAAWQEKQRALAVGL